MTRILKLAVLTLTTGALAACTTTGETERGAGYGAATGAAIGAGVGAVSGDVGVGEGAVIGAVIGGVAGGVVGNNRDKARNGSTTMRPNLDRSTRYYDDRTNRYYYYEQGTSRTFYENYELRTG